MMGDWLENCVECDLCGELYCIKCEMHYFECQCPGLMELCEGEDGGE